MTSVQPLVTVVIPTYNRRHLVGQAIDSALRQTYPNVEVIVSDDGSTDGTWEWLESCEVTLGKRVRRIRGPNSGPSGARDRGLRAADGEFVQFLDSDDVLALNKLELQLKAWRADGAGASAIICQGRLGAIESSWDSAQTIGALCGSADNYLDLLCSRVVHVMPTPAPLWQRQLLLAAGGWPRGLYHSEEWEFYIRLLLQRPRLVEVDEPLFWIRAHEGEQLSKDALSERQARSILSAHRLVVDALSRAGDLTEIRQIGLLQRLRTLYLNILRQELVGLVPEAESLITRLARDPRRRAFYLMLPVVRKALGNRFIPVIFDLTRRKASG